MPEESKPPIKKFERVCARCHMPCDLKYKGSMVDVSCNEVGLTRIPKMEYQHDNKDICIYTLLSQVDKLRQGVSLLVTGMDLDSFKEAQRRLETINLHLINSNTGGKKDEPEEKKAQ